MLDIRDDDVPLRNEMELDSKKQNKGKHVMSASQASEVSPEEASFLDFSQGGSKLYDGAVLAEGDLEEQYAFSQAAEISNDTDPYDWSASFRDLTISSQESNVEPEDVSLQQLPPTSSYPRHAATQEDSMEEDSSADITRESSDASIARLPTFRIPISRLASLKRLMQPQTATRMSNSTKIVVLAGVLDIDGPDYVRIRKGVDAGREVALLKLVVGDAEGGICKLTVWRELAEEWGDMLSKGDVVLFQDILFSRLADGTGSCTASKNTKSTATVCYRTILVTPEDRQFRPDLRLAAFDPAIARVAQVARWVERMRT